MLAQSEPSRGAEVEIYVDDNVFFAEPLSAGGEDAAPDRKGRPGKKRNAGGLTPAQGRSMPLRPGPKSLTETLASMRPAADAVDSRARSAGVDLHRVHPSTLGQVVHITTSYSGIGAGEAGVVEGCRHLRAISATRDGHEATHVQIQIHGAVECDNQCIEALKMHTAQSRAHHIFVDITDRIPARLRADLLQEVKRLRRKVEIHERLTRQIRGSKAAEQERASWVADLGHQFLQRAKKALSEVNWTECSHSWCVAHGQMCPLAPAAGPRDVWIEIAGSTCVAWSAMGSRWGWLDISSIPCLVWAAWFAHADVDCIMHENVRAFDWTFFNDWDMVKDKYWVASMCHSPVDQGIPVNRPRRYTVLLSRRLRALTAPLQLGGITADSGAELDPLPAPKLCYILIVAVSRLARLPATAFASWVLAHAWH